MSISSKSINRAYNNLFKLYMDKPKKITDKILGMSEAELKLLGSYVAKSLIELAKDSDREDWMIDDVRDQLVGELARCMTLQQIYLEREEYEKCALMKLRIEDINNTLGFSEEAIDEE